MSPVTTLTNSSNWLSSLWHIDPEREASSGRAGRGRGEGGGRGHAANRADVVHEMLSRPYMLLVQAIRVAAAVARKKAAMSALEGLRTKKNPRVRAAKTVMMSERESLR